MIRKPHPRLAKFLSAYEPRIGRMALALRRMVLREAPTATEMVWDAYNAVADGFSYSGRLKEAFIHIASYRDHVNLGFNWGARMPDPDRILEGEGNQIRHIRVASPAELKNPALKKYIKLAVRHSPVVPPERRVENQVIVKVMNTKKPKRRPSGTPSS